MCPPEAMDSAVIHTLRHIPDPSFKHLESLRHVRHLCETSTISELLSVIKEWPESVKVLPPRISGFSGRSSELKELQAAFSSYAKLGEATRSDQMSPCPGYMISGDEEVGKTALALEFCYTARESQLIYSAFRVPADSHKKIMECYKRFAVELGLVTEHTPEDVAMSSFMSWLHETSNRYWTEGMSERKSRRWLLVFDDVGGPRYLEKYWPQGGSGAVLVTTRSYDHWEAPYILEHLELSPSSLERLPRNEMTVSQAFRIEGKTRWSSE